MRVRKAKRNEHANETSFLSELNFLFDVMQDKATSLPIDILRIYSIKIFK